MIWPYVVGSVLTILVVVFSVICFVAYRSYVHITCPVCDAQLQVAKEHIQSYLDRGLGWKEGRRGLVECSTCKAYVDDLFLRDKAVHARVEAHKRKLLMAERAKEYNEAFLGRDDTL